MTTDGHLLPLITTDYNVALKARLEPGKARVMGSMTFHDLPFTFH